MSKIMIVDDDPRILGLYEKMLEKEGHAVIVAESGKKCLEILKNEKPDLILMDVRMPKMSGVEATRRIKQECPGIKVLVLTAHDDDEYVF